MYIVKIYRKNTVEDFEAIPVFALNEEEAKQKALNISLGKNEIEKITITK